MSTPGGPKGEHRSAPHEDTPVNAKARRAALQSVRIERSGGIAGLKASVELEGGALTAAQRNAVLTLVDTIGAPRAAPFAPAPDRFAYRVHVTDAQGRSLTLTLSEEDMPDALQGLCRPQVP